MKRELLFQLLIGVEAKAFIKDIANLRIEIFKEFPYLYAGTIENELPYLDRYISNENGHIILIKNIENNIVGFSSSIPLEDEDESMLQPYLENNLNPKDFLYCGEAIMYKEYRGGGSLKTLLDYHIKIAKKLNKKYLTMMTIDRADNHPSKPENFYSVDNMLEKYEYKKMQNAKIKYSWKSSLNNHESENSLSIWYKEI